jgi:peptidoglycan/xylan/chitin deacetylase (PgdA/CDA1 family)
MLRSDVILLCYHGVSEAWPADFSVGPDRLERQVTYLLGRGYEPATFWDAVRGRHGRRTFAVTFDDGYRSVYESGFPILGALRVPATVFVVTNYVGSTEPMGWPAIADWAQTPYRSQLLPLSWAQLDELVHNGWEIGSHTCSHPRLPDLPDDSLRVELEASRGELERRLGSPCRSLAYPFGAVDARVALAAARAGYSAAGALLPGRTRGPRDLTVPRVMVMRDDSDARFRRQVHYALRALQQTAVWPHVGAAVQASLPLRRRMAGVRRTRPQPPAGRARWRRSPALGFVADRGRVVTWRPAVLLVSLLSRLHLLDAYAVWPGVASPRVVVRPSERAVAQWIREHFDGCARVPVIDAATWNALRARAAVLPRSASPAGEAVRTVLGAEPSVLQVGHVSVTGAPLSKLLCFAFYEREPEPTAVLKVHPDPGPAGRLLSEVEFLDWVRERAAGSAIVTDALPPQPLNIARLRGHDAVVEPVDALARHTGEENRTASMRWLAAFHGATDEGLEPWDEPDVRAARELVDDAWARARRDARPAMTAETVRLGEQLRGRLTPRCAMHGDFWRGNIAHSAGAMRVYDWEWARRQAGPFFDLWTYELAELRNLGSRRRDELEPALRAALQRVSDELASRGLDPAFARATVAPAIAELAFRVRRLTGHPGGNEPGSYAVMVAVERLLAAADD